MELVQEKYVQTEIGLIPEDWKIIKLEENATLKARIGWQGLTTAEYLNSGDYCLVTGTDFLNGYVDWENCVFVEKERFDQDKNIQLKVEDVLVTKDGTIGKVAYVDKISKPTTLNSGVFVLRPKSPKIHNRFLYYVLMSFYFDDFLNKITAGSTITHLYQKDFVHFKFVLPSIEEQTAIASALSDADNWISSLKQLIAKKRLIKQGAMQELLQPKEGWEVKTLGKLFEITSSKRVFQSDWTSDGIPFYRARELAVLGEKGFVDNELFIRNEMYEEFKRQYGIPEIGDMLVTGVGTLGKTFLVSSNSKFYFKDGNIIWFKIKNSINSIFLQQLFLTPIVKKQIEDGSAGTTVGTYTINGAKKTIIPFPSPEEQTRIATILSDMDAEITALEGKLEKAKQVKLGMMQELLKGKIRLV